MHMLGIIQWQWQDLWPMGSHIRPRSLSLSDTIATETISGLWQIMVCPTRLIPLLIQALYMHSTTGIAPSTAPSRTPRTGPGTTPCTALARSPTRFISTTPCTPQPLEPTPLQPPQESSSFTRRQSITKALPLWDCKQPMATQTLLTRNSQYRSQFHRAIMQSLGTRPSLLAHIR